MLSGLSGAGKSTVGPLLAEALGVPFVDLDRRIEAMAGLTVSGIFEKSGETTFRALEATLLATELDAVEPRVIAAGGGALVADASRRRAHARATVVWLSVRPEDAAARCAAHRDRPLLAAGDAVERLSELLAARAAGYAEADLRVETSGRTPEEVADSILRAVRP